MTKNSSNIRVGIIGYGLSGSVFHAPFINTSKRFDLKKVSTKSRAAAVTSSYPETVVCDSPEEIINDPEIDLVINTAPNVYHFEGTKAALLAGKHVIVEKPFTNNTYEALELQRISSQQKRVLSVFHNRRWDADFLALKEQLAEGKIGDVTFYRSSFHRFSPQVKQRWREQHGPGAGVFFDLGSHLLDQVLNLFGIPSRVAARITCQRETASVNDSFSVTLEYDHLPHRPHVQVEASCLIHKPSSKFEVHGTRGSFICHGLDMQESQLKQGTSPTDTTFGVLPEFQYPRLFDGTTEHEIIPPKGNYEAFFEGVAEAIEACENNLPNWTSFNPVDPNEGVRIMRLLEACVQSNDERRSVSLAHLVGS